jgi:hypothetical protein
VLPLYGKHASIRLVAEATGVGKDKVAAILKQAKVSEKPATSKPVEVAASMD